MFRKVLLAALFASVANANGIEIDEQELSQISQERAKEAGEMLLELHEQISVYGAGTVTSELDEIMGMLDLNGNGQVSFTETMAAIQSIADMIKFTISPTGKGEIKYMWSLLDTDRDGHITKDEVRAILQKAPMVEKMSKWTASALQVGNY